MCFTDTDSLLYETKTTNIFQDMAEHIDDYDFSDYPKDYFLYNICHKKEIGKFKDELIGMTLLRIHRTSVKVLFITISGRSEKNIVIHTNITEKRTAKGTKESVKKAHLRHHHYKDTLNNLSIITVKQNVIKSKAHKIGIYHQNKVALTAFDTKRYICDDGINTLAQCHYKTRVESDWDEPIDILQTCMSNSIIDWDEPIDILL